MHIRTAPVVGGILAILVLPLWIVRYPPLVDYPNHLARAFILAHAQSPNFSKFYSPDWAPYPYLFMDAVLVLAQQVMSLPLAGRFLLTIGILAVPLSCWFFLRAANPGAELLSVFSLLFCYNPLFRSGFLNWHLSLSLCFLVLGIWLRFVCHPKWSLWLGLFLAAITLYFTHIVSFGVAGFVILAHSIFSKYSYRKIIASMLPFVPGALLYLHWARTAHSALELQSPITAAKIVYLLDPIRTGSRPMDVLLCVSLLACATYLLWRNHQLVWHRTWLFTSAAFALLYLLSPTVPGAYLDARLAYAVLILSFTVASPGPRLKRVAPLVLVLFSIQLSYVGWAFVRSQQELRNLDQSFAAISRGSRVLPIVQSHGEPLLERVYGHFWAYGILKKEYYSPYLLHSHGMNPMPLKFRITTYAPSGFGWLHYQDDLDWKRIAADYDFVWAYNVPRFEAALNAIAHRVFANSSVSIYRIAHQPSETAALPTAP